MAYTSDGESMRDFVETPWGHQVLAGELKYADNALANPKQQFFEMMTLDAGGPYFMRVSDPKTGTLSLLLKPLSSEQDFKDEHDLFMGKKWRAGDLWARCCADKRATVTILEEENPGWREVRSSEEDKLFAQALGALSVRKKELLDRLIMRAGLQWGREDTDPSGFLQLAEGQVRRKALLRRGIEIDVWH